MSRRVRSSDDHTGRFYQLVLEVVRGHDSSPGASWREFAPADSGKPQSLNPGLRKRGSPRWEGDTPAHSCSLDPTIVTSNPSAAPSCGLVGSRAEGKLSEGCCQGVLGSWSGLT